MQCFPVKVIFHIPMILFCLYIISQKKEIIVMALVVGVCFYTKYRKENEIPTDGMLVYDNSEDEDVDKIWA